MQFPIQVSSLGLMVHDEASDEREEKSKPMCDAIENFGYHVITSVVKSDFSLQTCSYEDVAACLPDRVVCYMYRDQVTCNPILESVRECESA